VRGEEGANAGVVPEASETHAGRWNAVRCVEGALGGHVESYFLKLNDPNGRQALWLKATILVREGGAPRVAQAWAVAFDREGRHVAAKQTVPLSDARFDANGLRLKVADLTLVPGRVSGAVASGARRIAFDLRFTMDAEPLIPFPSERMYQGRLPSFKIMSPHPDSRFQGSYSVDGETVVVDGWRGMQGHNWGARHSASYAWGHVNQWEGQDDLVVEGFTARVKLGPVLVPPLTVICVRHDGVRYDFNAPLAMVRAGRPIELGRWAFASKTARATVTGELWADPHDFVGLAYENPDGTVSYCLNSKIARGRIRLSVRGRPDVEAMTGSAALEILTLDANHGVTMHA
jgi:hypothetical protein